MYVIVATANIILLGFIGSFPHTKNSLIYLDLTKTTTRNSNCKISQMAAIRRLQEELESLKSKGFKWLKEVRVPKDDLLHWTLILQPQVFPYNQGCYTVQLNFPVTYPLQPPKLYFETRIYHPNVDSEGISRLPLLEPENWTGGTTPKDIFLSLMDLLESPDTGLLAVRQDLAQEFLDSKERFLKNALDHAQKHSGHCEE